MNASRRGCLVGLVLLAAAGPVCAQGPTISDSSVGYIDGAIPGNTLRLRFDDAVNIHAYNRGEFLSSHADNHSLPLEESRIDYQELSAYAEFALSDRFSLFIEQPLRYLEAEINRDHFGLVDINAGFKWAFLKTDDTVATFQFRTYAPTGDASRGLGTHHTTLEPAILIYHSLGSGFSLEGETRLSIPLGGQAGFESEVVRYGLGMQYQLFQGERLSICPVVEFVGWTFLNGQKDLIVPGQAEETNSSAEGDTIVNAKVGVRFKLSSNNDIYAGYGRALTGSTLYKDIYRVEWRLHF